ncbi:hypothetical protein [Limnobacter sp.]|nr:hypothetical protein [Nostoc sp. CHAB 5844]
MKVRARLRINSGLMEGQILDLTDGTFVFGQSDEATILLLDENIPSILFQLEVSTKGLAVYPKAEEVFFSTDNSEPSLVSDAFIMASDFCLSYKSVELSFEFAIRNDQVAQAESHQSVEELDYFEFNFEPLRKIRSRMSQEKGTLTAIGFSGLLGVITVVSLAVLLSVLGTSESSASADSVKTAKMQMENTAQEQRDSMIHLQAAEADVLQSMPNELLSRLSVRADTDRLEIVGQLNRQQLLTFEKELLRLNLDYGDHIIIQASVELDDEQKLIDELAIQQIILGSTPVAIARNGERLMVGSQYRGLTVKGINHLGVELQGESTYRLSI